MEILDSPEEILRILIELQNLEAKASTLQKEIEQIPAEISQQEQELDTFALRLQTAKDKTSTAEKVRKSLENDVEILRQKISNYKNQLMSVKTNAEYQAMLKEISFVEKQIEEKEDGILEQMLESDQLNEVVREVGKVHEEKKQAFTEQKGKLEARAKEAHGELQELSGKRTALENALPREYLSRYRRIASARNGQAIAFLVDQNCSACHVRLRPQLIADVKTGKKIIQCENCSRILISS